MPLNTIKSRVIALNSTTDLSSVEDRLSILENNEYKISYFETISSATGNITIPTGATIQLDQLQGGADAYVSTISNGQPTGILPTTGGGTQVDVTSFDALGNYTLTGTPSSFPVALIYILTIKSIDYFNLDETKILDLEEIKVDARSIADGSIDNTEFQYLNGVTSNIQTQLNNKSNVGHTHVLSDITGYQGYTYVAQGASFSPGDTTIYVYGPNFNNAPTTVGSNRRIYILKSGTIKAVATSIICTVGTSELSTLSIRLNNTTDTSVHTTLNLSTATSFYQNTSLSIPVTVGDYIEMKWTTPTWVTNPTTVTLTSYIYIE